MGVLPIISCVDQQCDGPCGCFPVFEQENFSVTQLSIEAIFRSETSVPYDPEKFYFYRSFYLGIWASEFRKINESGGNITQASGFFPMALANCSSGEVVSLESLTGLKVINTKPIQLTADEYLDEGDDITDKFLATTNFQQEVDIENFLKRKHRFQEKVRFHMRFNQKPSAAMELVVEVIVALDNGNSYTFRDQRLKISP